MIKFKIEYNELANNKGILMKKTQLLIFAFLFSLFIPTVIYASPSFFEEDVKLQTASGELFGTLTLPEGSGKRPLVLFVTGSGPVDRDGNIPMMKNDGFKKLACALAEEGIASLRYDKRGIGESAAAGKDEASLRFHDYINDLKAWISLVKKDNRFSRIIVVGHSEGSLIGMVASSEADGFISIAGAGEPVDAVLKRQLSTQSQQIQDFSYPIIDSLKLGQEVSNVNPMLFSLFRPSVQPYLISWIKYDPQSEIRKLKVPVLIVQGTNDIQVTVEDANHLSTAKPDAQLIVIENMNHVFRIVEGESRQNNLATYNNPELPVSKELIESIINFVKK